MAPKLIEWLMASSAMLLRQWQRKSEPFQQEHPEQMWRDCELRSCGSMRQSRSCVASGVRADVNLVSGNAARQHERPPELESQGWRKNNTANRVATLLDHALLVLVVACRRAMPPNLGATRTRACPGVLWPACKSPKNPRKGSCCPIFCTTWAATSGVR